MKLGFIHSFLTIFSLPLSLAGIVNGKAGGTCLSLGEAKPTRAGQGADNGAARNLSNY